MTVGDLPPVQQFRAVGGDDHLHAFACLPEQIEHRAQCAGVDCRLRLFYCDQQWRRSLKHRGQQANRAQGAVGHVESFKPESPRRTFPPCLGNLQRQVLSISVDGDSTCVWNNRFQERQQALEVITPPALDPFEHAGCVRAVRQQGDPGIRFLHPPQFAGLDGIPAHTRERSPFLVEGFRAADHREGQRRRIDRWMQAINVRVKTSPLAVEPASLLPLAEYALFSQH